MLRTISRDQGLDELTEKVAIIIPTLNEEPSVGSVIDSVPVNDLLEHGFRTYIYVIDGLSVDHTREIAAQKGAQLVTEKKPGKGAAIQTAFRVIDADYLIVVDGDDTYPISAALEMLRLLQTHDVVIGSRFKGFIDPEAMTRLNVVGNKLLTLFARVLFNDNISDVCTGLWGFRRDAINCLKLHARGFEIEVDIRRDRP